MAGEIVEYELAAPWEGFLATPAAGPAEVGVVVLSGSSGRIERERCRLFARAGVTAASIRWFGRHGQPPGICEVALETFVAATELLRERGAERVSILGVSKGAEAALLVSTLSDCADAVIALAPTSVVWANVGPGRDGRERPCSSSWTWQEQPLPFVPYDDSWMPTEPEGTPISVLGSYERSLATYADLLPAAAIPVERSAAELVLIAGGADRMWPSLRFAHELADRYAATGRELAMISRPDAGHRSVFPGEVARPPPSGSTTAVPPKRMRYSARLPGRPCWRRSSVPESHADNDQLILRRGWRRARTGAETSSTHQSRQRLQHQRARTMRSPNGHQPAAELSIEPSACSLGP